MGSMIEVLAMNDAEFFAPVSSDLVDSLVGQYQNMHRRIEELYSVVTGEMAGAMSYVLEGNSSQDRYPPSVDHLFGANGKANAIGNLTGAYWSKALQMTDVIDWMPQKRRDEWFAQIKNPLGRKKSKHTGECELPALPAFEEDTVRSTLQSMMAMRIQFLAERVDGIFRGLSGEHVTNSPAAFGKRMIVSRVLSEHCGYEDYRVCGLINDLRCVVAKFMGRDEPKHNASSGLIRALRGNWGQWVSVDGGAMKIRLYMKGTAHIEVHPDMAWRLNSILAHMYPLAIPAEFRTKPKRKAKEVALIQRPLPFAVLEILADMKQASRGIKQEGNWRDPVRYEKVRNAMAFDYSAHDKHAKAEAESVLESIGGTKAKEGWFQFDYDAANVISEIVASGCIPDDKAFQFYPTPAGLAQRVVELAEIDESHRCLEPSAGTGAIADLMPKGTTCCEVSALRCAVLEAKGHTVFNGDFMATSGFSADRICMNPPFDQGRWKAHLEHAATLIRDNGRIVAILPSGAKNSTSLPGFSLTWHGPFDNQFPGASVSVVILVAERQQ